MDASRVGSVRLCQLYEAVVAQKSDRRVCIVATGIKKKHAAPSAEEIKFEGHYNANLEVAMGLKKQFTGKAVDVNDALNLAMLPCGDRPPCAILRVAMNSLVPIEGLASVRERAKYCLPY